MNADMFPRRPRLAAAGWLLTAVALLAAGCGSSRKPAAAPAPRPAAATPAPAPAAPAAQPKPAAAPAAPAPAAKAPAPVAAPALVPVVKVVASNLPTTAPRNASETFFGTVVDDPYRHLEDTKSPETAAWMKAQSDFAAATLKRIPGRAGLIDRITRLEDAVPARVANVVRAPGDLYVYESRGAGDNQFKLVVRQGLDGAERVLVDPDELEKKSGKPHAISYFSVSPDAKYVAYGLAEQGAEDASLHVMDMASGKPVGKPISRVYWGAVDWSSDSKQIIYLRFRELKKGDSRQLKYQDPQTVRQAVGAAEGTAQVVFGNRLKGPKIASADTPFVSLTADGKWALGIVSHGTQREFDLYVAPQASLRSGTPRWQPLFDTSAGVTSFAYFNDRLYLRSHRDAPRSQVLLVDLAKPDVTQARVLVPHSDKVLAGIAAAADALYVEMREGNVKRLYKLPHADVDKGQATLKAVPLPVDGSFRLEGDEGPGVGDPRFPGLVLPLESWIRARQIYLVEADGTVRNSGLQPAGPNDAPDNVTVTETEVRSHDGALVPMSIIHRKNVVLDGRNPTLLTGYASYGINIEPAFGVGRLAWLEAGGVVAVANPRGSSIKGQEWYKAGFQATKPNTWKDFIACAEYLVARKFTSPERLGILGGSAGGILVGRAMTERPDLFAAVIPAVGVMDMVRAEVTPNGVPNIPEFGTRQNEAGFRSLLAMSTYHQIKDGTRYPAVMLTHGVNDPRVEVWHSSKTAARLLAAGTGGRPVLLRLDYASGHGVGDTKQQDIEERADMYAFLLWQMGMPGFQPQ